MRAQSISESEINQFLDGVRNLGYDASDFLVAGERRDLAPTEPHATLQEIRVGRISTGVHGAYRARHSYSWIAEALSDVQRGVFGER
jgi:hypothetical protein